MRPAFRKAGGRGPVGEPGQRPGARGTIAFAGDKRAGHWINAHLQAPVDLIEPVDRTAGGRDAGSLSRSRERP